MTQALDYLKLHRRTSPRRRRSTRRPSAVVYRDQRLERDNGLCKNTFELNFFQAQGPPVGRLQGERGAGAERGRLIARRREGAAARSSRCETAVVYEPAKPGQRMGIVVAQIPAGGTLSSWQKVTVVLPKSLHGVVPRVVGLTVAQAQGPKLAKLKVRVRVTGPRASGKVVSQSRAAGTASAAGLTITLRTHG